MVSCSICGEWADTDGSRIRGFNLCDSCMNIIAEIVSLIVELKRRAE